MMSFCEKHKLKVLVVLFCSALVLCAVGWRSSDVFTINILALNDTSIKPVLENHAEAWAASTGIKVSFQWINGMDNLHEAMKKSMNSLINIDYPMDGFLFASSWLGDTHAGLANLANSIKTEKFWDDALSFVQVFSSYPIVTNTP